MMIRTENSTYEVDEENKRIRRIEDRADVGKEYRDEWRTFEEIILDKPGAVVFFAEEHTDRSRGQRNTMWTSPIVEIWE